MAESITRFLPQLKARLQGLLQDLHSYRLKIPSFSSQNLDEIVLKIAFLCLPA